MLNICDRLEVLREILPYVRRFIGKVVIIKYGGSTMDDIQLKNKIIEDIVLLSSIGMKPILVHGGGPVINRWLKKCNITPKFADGIRITDAYTMEIVEMVLMGKINKELVSLIYNHNGQAVGISGKDGNLITAKPMYEDPNNFTGRIADVNTDILNSLLEDGYIPVVSSVSADISGLSYNINADLVAGELASSLQADKLVFLTNQPGIMLDVTDQKTLINQISSQDIESLKVKKVISGGMIPKVDSCIHALNKGVKSTYIVDGGAESILLLTCLMNLKVGSRIII